MDTTELDSEQIEENSSMLSMDDIRVPEDFDFSELSSDSLMAGGLIEDVMVPAHISEMMVPFAETPAGNNPEYSDDFVVIKNEMEKLTGNNYDEVIKRSRNILLNTGKDIRVAGYYLQSAVYVQGIQGLTEGIMLCRLLIDMFYADIHPHKESAKLSSLQWLNNNKIVIYAKHAIEECTETQLKKLKTEILQFNAVLNNLIAEKPPLLMSLNKLLGDAKPKQDLFVNPKSNQEQINTKADKEKSINPVYKYVANDNNNVEEKKDSVVRIKSELELLENVGQICKYLLDKKEYLRTVNVMNAARWGGLNIPQNDRGVTQLPFTGLGVKNEISNLISNKQFEQAFIKCQENFLIHTNHLLFDLQYLAYKAADGMGKTKLSEHICSNVCDLVNRLPGIQDLKFKYGTPFSDSNTLSWINDINNHDRESAPPSLQENVFNKENEPLYELQEKAVNLFMSNGLQSALDKINDFESENEKDTFEVNLLIAKLCMDDGKINIAVPMLEELYNQAISKLLYLWEPELAMTIAINLKDGLLHAMKQGSETQNERYQILLDALASQMCRWDPVKAAKLL